VGGDLRRARRFDRASGRVVSREAPFGAVPRDAGLALLAAGAGTYRTLLLGGDRRARGSVRLDVHGKRGVLAFAVERGRLRAASTTRIEETRTWQPCVRASM
jgi:hypothetical protein